MSDLHDLDELTSLVKSTERRSAHDSPARTRRHRDRDGEVSREVSDGEVKDGRMWAVYGGRNYSACERAVEKLPPGQYTINHSDEIGIYFRDEDINLDELIVLPDSKSEEVIEEIQRFWTLEEDFRKFGFLWKRGVMMWGPPGSGKTSTLQLISKNIVDQGGISVYVDNPSLAAKALKALRQVEPTRQVIIMLEDIDAIIDEYGESDLLALMDGELQIDNVVFVATTNYPERLDRRLINRPSRFDIVKKIGMPSVDAREVYLKAKNSRLAAPESNKELRQWIELTNDFSIAHIKELIISVEVFRQPLDEAVARLRKMSNNVSSSSSGKSVGFLGANGDDD